MQNQTRLFFGITLLTVPTIVYGGLTLLGVITAGGAGLPGPTELTPLQASLYRAGHAHAGVLLLLSLLLQLGLEAASLSPRVRLAARVAAPSAAILVSAGFFGLAHLPMLRALLYLGASLLFFATMATGLGLVRRPDPTLRADSV